jgi:hypothetical protein
VTSYQRILAGVAATGIPHFSNSSNIVTETISAIVEADITLAANTTNNVSTTKHGFAPVLPNDATKYLDGTGNYTVPAGGGGGTTINATDLVIPYRSSSTAFTDSPITVSIPGSMVDGFTVTGAATANPATVTLAATGSDSNIHQRFLAKGTANYFFDMSSGNNKAVFAGTASTGDNSFWIEYLAGPGFSRLIADRSANQVHVQGDGVFLGNGGSLSISSSAKPAGTDDIVLTRAAASVLKLGGASTNGSALQLPQKAATPANPASSAEVNFYIKGNKIVFQFNDGGTVRYATYDLTQSATAIWATSTSAP